jgi:hypothetical protein
LDAIGVRLDRLHCLACAAAAVELRVDGEWEEEQRRLRFRQQLLSPTPSLLATPWQVQHEEARAINREDVDVEPPHLEAEEDEIVQCMMDPAATFPGPLSIRWRVEMVEIVEVRTW